MSRLYLDHNSTTPLLPEVADEMSRVQRDMIGNPSSAHRSGAAARAVLEEARQQIAQCLGAYPDEVIFTSGATEANNLAIFGSLHVNQKTQSSSYANQPFILVSTIEHPSVIEPCRMLEKQGYQLIEIKVDGQGYVRGLPDVFNDSSWQSTAHGLMTLQLANHETGVVQDISRWRRIVEKIPFHTDATQAVGKIPVNFHELGVSTLSCSAHKLHGPAGIGALLVNRCTHLQPRLYGGHQQNGLRPGTEPVALAVGFARALRLASDQMAIRQQKCVKLRHFFLNLLQCRIADLVINGDLCNGLPHTINLSFPGCSSDILFIRLDLAGIDCSTGSACSSGSLLPSPVLKAMQVHDNVLRSAIRFSISHILTEQQIEDAALRIVREVLALRESIK